MQDLREFTPEQIIARARFYERKMRWLQADARQFIAGERNDEKEILSRYHALRKEISQESKYLESYKGEIYYISEVHDAYQNGMDDCRRNGFSHATEKKVSNRIVSILEEAIYRLTKELDYMGVYK